MRGILEQRGEDSWRDRTLLSGHWTDRAFDAVAQP
jgi:hypothetical protein